MKRQFIECGKIVSTHGIKGEMKIMPWTDDVSYLLGFSRFFLENGRIELKVKTSRIHKNMLLLLADGISDMDTAAKYRGQVICLARDDDPDDSPFLIDFIGVEVTDVDTGEAYGKILDVVRTGANDVYVLRGGDKERLVPDIPQVIIETDLKARTMKIRPLKGLFD